MSRLMHGIVHGRTIELGEDLGLSEGQAVDLIVMPAQSREPHHSTSAVTAPPKTLPGPPPGWRPGIASDTAGILADDWTDEDDEILAQIQADRKSAAWRELPL